MSRALSRFPSFEGQTGVPFGLKRMRAALARLGNPQTLMPPGIHICGTNGKGSVAAFLGAIAAASGTRAHVYTSPHLIRVNERVRLAGRKSRDDELAAALDRAADTEAGLSLFEGLTVAAFDLFARHEADMCVIETGAGGDLDATSAATGIRACVVAPVGHDHEAMFGVRGLAAIAGVKAGILRRGVPAAIAAQDPEVEAVLRQRAENAGAPTRWQGTDWQVGTAAAFRFRSADIEIDGVRLGLTGAHQATNAGLACAAWLEMVRAGVIAPADLAGGMRRGLAAARWPGRLQALGAGPVLARAGMPVIVDGAHNPPAARALAAEIGSAGGRSALMLAIGANKDADDIVAPLARVASTIVACPLPGGGCVPPPRIVALARAAGTTATVASDWRAGLDRAEATGGDRLYAAGSLRLVAALLEANGDGV